MTPIESSPYMNLIVISRLFFTLALFYFLGAHTGLLRYVAESNGDDYQLICLLEDNTEESEKSASEKESKDNKETTDDLLTCIPQPIYLSQVNSGKYLGTSFHQLVISFTGDPASPPPEC